MFTLQSGKQHAIANPLGAKTSGGWRGDLDNDTYVSQACDRMLADAEWDQVAFDVTGTGPGVRSGGAETDTHTALRARPPGQSEGSTTTLIAATLRGNPWSDHAGDESRLIAFGGNNTAGPIDVATACNAHGGPHGRLDFETETFITHSLRAGGFDASEDGTGRGTPLIAVDWQNSAGGPNSEDAFMTLGGERTPAVMTLAIRGRGDSHDLEYRDDGIANAMSVRRLLPVETERLQGFPDGWTDVPYRGKPAADGPRYRAVGNSMAVPVIGWVLARVQQIAAAITLEEAPSTGSGRATA